MDVSEERKIDVQQMKLNLILEKYQTRIKQRTDEWFKQRKSLVGSSELYYLKTKFNTFKENKLKVKNTKSVDNNPCAMGILFEPIALECLKKIIKTDCVGELGCIPYHDTSVKLGASPDGIAVMDDLSVHSIEIKCPMLRKVQRKPGEWIPKQYIHQVQAQMMCIPECVNTIFADFQFRVCSKKQFMTNAYNRWIHLGRSKCNPFVNEVMTRGIIEFTNSKYLDIGRGKWNYKTNKMKVDLAPWTFKDKLYHNFIKDDHCMFKNNNARLYWHLDNVIVKTVKPDKDVQREIIDLCSNNVVKDILKISKASNSSSV